MVVTLEVACFREQDTYLRAIAGFFVLYLWKIARLRFQRIDAREYFATSQKAR